MAATECFSSDRNRKAASSRRRARSTDGVEGSDEAVGEDDRGAGCAAALATFSSTRASEASEEESSGIGGKRCRKGRRAQSLSVGGGAQRSERDRRYPPLLDHPRPHLRCAVAMSTPSDSLIHWREAGSSGRRKEDGEHSDAQTQVERMAHNAHTQTRGQAHSTALQHWQPARRSDDHTPGRWESKEWRSSCGGGGLRCRGERRPGIGQQRTQRPAL